MIRLSVRIAGLAAAIVLSAAAAAQAKTYVVVINEANSAAQNASDPKAVVKRLFLKRQTQWPNNGPSALPMARKSDSAVQKAFRAKVLGMSKSEVQSHWASMKQTQGETPPREVGTALILFRRLRREPGAFTVLSKDELSQAPGEVRVLYEFEHQAGQ